MELTKMTPKQIDQVAAGAELDLLIQDYVMKWTRTREKASENFSTDLRAAWLVVEQMKSFRLFLNDTGEGWRVFFVWDDPPGQPGIEGRGETAPLAICRAALKTVMKGNHDT